MNKPKLAFGLNLTKPGASKSAPSQRKHTFCDDDTAFYDDDSGNEDTNGDAQVEEIGGDLDDYMASISQPSDSARGSKSRKEPLKEPPKLKSKLETHSMFGGLSSSFASRKNAEAAAELDASIYEYDSIYDSLKPKKSKTKEDEERKPRYMQGLMHAAEVRKRDALIAQEKKIAREREAEGDDYVEKEEFVTASYKRQQEENKKVQEEVARKEEEEAKKSKDTGMSAFYKKLLEKKERRHVETMKAVEEMAKEGPKKDDENNEGDEDEDKAKARLAKELNDKGADIAVNEDGQVVDKRELLKGGLNVVTKKKEAVQRETNRSEDRDRRDNNRMQHSKKQAMRERQSRMLVDQLESSLKRTRDAEDARKEDIEREAKSRKTQSDVSSAKERYLARKRAEEEKKKAAAAE